MDLIKDLSNKGRIMVRKIWKLEERLCKDDFRKKWILYKYLKRDVIRGGNIGIEGKGVREDTARLRCIF